MLATEIWVPGESYSETLLIELQSSWGPTVVGLRR